MSEDPSASASVPQPPEHLVLRTAVAEANPHVSLRRAVDTPEVWKISLADVEAGLREEDLVEKVRPLFETETQRPIDIAKANAIS